MCAERLLKIAEVRERVGLGRTAIYSRMKKGTFPQSIKAGSASRWAESEIEAWLSRAKKRRVTNEAWPD